MEYKVFDEIVLKDGRQFRGIVDYSSKKQIYFFDFTNQQEVDYYLIAMLWRGNTTTLRFSVYCSLEYPALPLPKAVLIPKNNIDTITANTPENNTKTRKKRIKIS